MTTRRLLLSIVLPSLALATIATSQEPNRFFDLSVAELARTWLTRNCGFDEEHLLEEAVLRQARELLPVFKQGWEQGPDEALLREIERGAAERFARNRAALGDPESLGLSAEDAERAAARSEEDFVARASASFVVGYRTQALRGLHLVGGDEERQLLERVATDADDTFSAVARRLLAAQGVADD